MVERLESNLFSSAVCISVPCRGVPCHAGWAMLSLLNVPSRPPRPPVCQSALPPPFLLHSNKSTLLFLLLARSIFPNSSENVTFFPRVKSEFHDKKSKRKDELLWNCFGLDFIDIRFYDFSLIEIFWLSKNKTCIRKREIKISGCRCFPLLA